MSCSVAGHRYLDMGRPFSQRVDIPNLNQRSFVYVGAHVVAEDATGKGTVSPRALGALLEAAKRRGWSVNLCERNTRKLILTFDDGRRFDDTLAGVLDDHGATAIFFVCTAEGLGAYQDRPLGELSQENRQYLLARHVVGGHTHAHTDLRALARSQQRALLEDSAERFAHWFGFRPWLFAYPWGRYRVHTLRVLRTIGVRYGFIAAAGALYTHDLLIPRVLIDQRGWTDGDYDFVMRARASVPNNVKLLMRRAHIGLVR